MARILVVSTNDNDMKVAEAAVAGGRHYVQHTASGLDACLQVAEHRPDVVIIGQTTSDQDGLAVARHLRHNVGTDSYLMMPLDEDSIETRTDAYQAGIDDTMPRPLDVAEVGLRLKATLRRRKRDKDVLSYGDLRLDIPGCCLFVKDKRHILPPTALRIMTLLMEEPGRVWSADDLLEGFYGDKALLHDPAAIRMSVLKTRRIIGNYIENVYGHGYRVIGELA